MLGEFILSHQLVQLKKETAETVSYWDSVSGVPPPKKKDRETSGIIGTFFLPLVDMSLCESKVTIKTHSG